jgi:hypothetical protein
MQAKKIKTSISRSFKFEIKRKINTTLSLIKSFYFWKWQKNVFFANETGEAAVLFFGNSRNKWPLMALLGLTPNDNKVECSAVKNKLFITDFPMPNTLCVPATLATMVSLDQSVDDILASYSRSLRRSIVGQRADYRYETVNDLDKIVVTETELLKPYANARHENAHHLGLETIINLATSEYGRLDLLYSEEEIVGCHLGNSYERRGKKYWHVNRFGYPPSVFSDYKRWGEVNSMNLHLALEAAIQEGYDYCDYGTSLARPGAGLIEWKRRRKGFLAEDYGIYFYLKLPKIGAAQFFWNSPLFAIEDHKITLHLGVPREKTDEEVMARYNEMGYGGLYKVYLHSNSTLNETLLQSIRNLYVDQKTLPEIISNLVD